MRIDARRIAFSVAMLAIAGGVAVVATTTWTRTEIAAVPPDDTPLDISGADTRHALDAYARFTLGRGLDAIAPTCVRGSDETYRLVEIPGLVVDEDVAFVAIDVTAAGGNARVDERHFERTNPASGEMAWILKRQDTLDGKRVDAARAAADRWLLSGKPAAGPYYIDAPETYIELCRRGRYHFAARSGATLSPAGNREFIALVDALGALRAK
jgi:hypothetical protein